MNNLPLKISYNYGSCAKLKNVLCIYLNFSIKWKSDSFSDSAHIILYTQPVTTSVFLPQEHLSPYYIKQI